MLFINTNVEEEEDIYLAYVNGSSRIYTAAVETTAGYTFKKFFIKTRLNVFKIIIFSTR